MFTLAVVCVGVVQIAVPVLRLGRAENGAGDRRRGVHDVVREVDRLRIAASVVTCRSCRAESQPGQREDADDGSQTASPGFGQHAFPPLLLAPPREP